MRAIVTAVVAAIEGCAAAVASIAVIAIPAVLLWVVTFGIAAEPQDVAAAVAGVWLLAHLVPMQFNLSQGTMLSMGLGSDPLTFTLSLAPLAITLITVAFAVRAGLRLSRRGGRGAAGLLGGVIGFAAVSFGVVTLADTFNPWPLAGAIATPALVYLVPAVAAFVIAAAISGEHWWGICVRGMQRGIEYLGVHGGVAAFPARAANVARLTAGSLAGVVGVAAVAVAVALATGFADVIELAQALQLDALGSTLMFLAQLAILPIGVIWAIAWLSGAGFEAGGAFSPFADGASSLPSLPVLGALPTDWGSFGALAPTMLVLANLAVGFLLAQRSELRRATWTVALTLPVLAAAATGLAVAGLGVLGSGSMGPGRLEMAGPNPWLVGGLVAAEAAVGLLLGVTAARLDFSRVQEMLPEPIARWNSARAARAGAGVEGSSFDVSPDDAKTVDLSSVRDDLGADASGIDDLADLADLADAVEASAADSLGADSSGADATRAGRAAQGAAKDDAEGRAAPVIDLFEGVLHDRQQRAVDGAAEGGSDGFDADGFGVHETDVLETEALDTDALDPDALDTAILRAEALSQDTSHAGTVGRLGGDNDTADDGTDSADTAKIEPEAFDIESMKDTGEVPDAREQPREAAGNALEDADEIALAFAWDADATGPNETVERQDEAPDGGRRGRFGLPNWRGPRGKG